MDEYDFKLDVLQRPIPNVKIGRDSKKTTPSKRVGEEVKELHLSDKSQQMIMETLRFIHGPDYSLDDSSKYVDKQLRLNTTTQHSDLLVKGGFHHTESSTETEADISKMFAIFKLESYGFHQSHCLEALEHMGDVEKALDLLYTRYMGINKYEGVDSVEQDLLEQREEEKDALESIYEAAFEEILPNGVWLLKLKLEYLVNMFRAQKNTNNLQRKVIKGDKKKNMCRGFLAGDCKYGNKCRFSHAVSEELQEVNPNFSDYTFELEIKFPTNTKYPLEPPFIFLKTNFSLPELMKLHICKKLYEEAQVNAIHGTPSIYSVVELLRNEEVIKEHITGAKINFLLPFETIIPGKNTNVKDRSKIDKYHKKGITKNDNKKEFVLGEILEVDKKIANKYKFKKKEQNYQKIMNVRKNLPIWEMQNDIVNTIKSSQVTVISGETGCGKSTQVPQFLLDDWLTNFNNKSNHVEIVCTQPRKISAIGVAERVAQERCESIGNVVGYRIRLESKVSINTRLAFCTTGILLRRLEGDPTLTNVSHIILDEVHERSLESDFLLLILKELLERRADLKIIIMSATLNADFFSNYFGEVPVIEVPGRTFPVEHHFLEGILDITGFVLEENTQYTRRVNEDITDLLETELSSAASNLMPKDSLPDEKLSIAQMFARYENYGFKICKNLYLMDLETINMELIEELLLWIVSGQHEYPREGSILIFLPGIAEITTMYDRLRDNATFAPRHKKFVILPLHSSLSSKEQAAIFEKPENGARKIILSTNLAETSITIDDCVFVIDSGKMKEKRFDSNSNMESLDTVCVTRANAIQRKGRAGRIMPGYCFHLFTSHRFKYHLLPQQVPEIHRVPLEQLLLNIKVLSNFENRDLHQVLASVMDPPHKNNIDTAIQRLQDVGAFDKNNNLTPLGQHLAALPVDVRIGKLMLYGAIFSCVDSALTIAAFLSYKNPFVSPFGKKEEVMAKKKEFAVGQSDHLTILRAYKKWQEVKVQSRIAGKYFADRCYLSLKTLEMLADLKYQFLELLVSIGFVPVNLVSHRHRASEDNVLSLTGPELNKNSDNLRVLMSVLCVALYPNVTKVLSPTAAFQNSLVGAVPVTQAAKELKFKTKQEEVFLHPSSINFDQNSFQSPYLVYQEKIRTSRIYIRDCSVVPTIALVLFSGSQLDIYVSNGVTFITLADGWITFRVGKHQIAEMIKAIQLELEDLLEEKIKDPLLNLLHSEKGERIINTILHMVTKD